MLHTKNSLLTIMLVACVISLAIIVAFEFDVLPIGAYADHVRLGFYAAVVMELVTICTIPLALRLFKFRKVRHALTSLREKALLRWGSLRMLMLCVPMMVNTLCYYLFMNVAFAYMAIILFICLFLVYPSLDRCYSEIPDKPATSD
jgi:hypothetical protein